MDNRANDQLTKNVYEFVVQHKRDHDGNSPSHRQIRDGCGMSSHSLVKYHLNKLVEAGLIRFGGNGSTKRSIEVVGAVWQPPIRVEIPG